MNPLNPLFPTRREFLRQSGFGFGSLALSHMLQQDGLVHAGVERSAGANLQPRSPHFAPQATAVIEMVQNGGPSQMDLFDRKPELHAHAGKPYPGEIEFFQKDNINVLVDTPFEFTRYGQCGMEMAKVIPHIGSVADDLCLVRSMYTEHANHTEGLIMLQTGKIFPGRPVMGSWISYALGTENQNLPAYVVLRDPAGYNTSGTLVWANGWLPSLYRGTEFSSDGPPVLNLQPSRDLPAEVQQEMLALVGRLNEKHRKQYESDSRLEARIRNYELAARMQLHAQQALDISVETEATHRAYGLDRHMTAGYGKRCLMARRLVEAGVRFIQIHPPLNPSFQPWDSHYDTKGDITTCCAQTDQPTAALIRDLKERGLLESTIVLWTGEFGRLPTAEGKHDVKTQGRDHNRNAFSLILSGGGFRSGHIHGATDEFGYRSVEGRVSVPDLHATLLHQLGLDHRKLTYRHHGRDETLTDPSLTAARVVGELLDHPPQVV